MAAAFHEISGGRLDINIVPGGIQNDFERVGEVSSHATRYERAEEFIEACRALWQEPQPVSYKGDFYRLEDAYCAPAPGDNAPRFYLGGASPRALGLSSRQADVHLGWIEPLPDTTQRVNDLREQLDVTGRPVNLGLRTHLVIRDSEAEAWDAARSLISDAAPEVKAQRQSAIAGTPMVGQQAQATGGRGSSAGPANICGTDCPRCG